MFWLNTFVRTFIYRYNSKELLKIISGKSMFLLNTLHAGLIQF
jgi:hypothetical protein